MGLIEIMGIAIVLLLLCDVVIVLATRHVLWGLLLTFLGHPPVPKASSPPPVVFRQRP